MNSAPHTIEQEITRVPTRDQPPEATLENSITDEAEFEGQRTNTLRDEDPLEEQNVQPFDTIQEEEHGPVRRTKFRKRLVIGVLYLCFFPSTLDMTIIATAIPTISANFHTTAGYAWIGSAYLLANAAAAPLWARFSDIWGRKPILLTSEVIFFVGSILCAVAVDMPMLIVGRAIQGSASGGIQILCQVCIADLTSMRERGFYIALTEVVWTISSGLGPVLGGLFSQHVSWRWVFWINLPICGVSVAAVWLTMDLHNPRTDFRAGMKAIDWFGCFTITAVTVMFLLGLDFGGVTFPWQSPKVIVLIVVGLCLIGAFVFGEVKMAKYPLMPPHLFGRRSNVAALLVAFAHGFVSISGGYFLPLYFQSVDEASPSRSGVLLLPLVICEAVAGVMSGAITSRTGRYVELVWTGMLSTTLSIGLYILFDAHSSLGLIVGLEILAGLSTGQVYSPPFTAVQTLVKQEERSAAIATCSFVRTLSTALSVVIGSVVFQNSMKSHEPMLQANLPKNLALKFAGDNAAANVGAIGMLSAQAKELVKIAFAASLRNMWIMYTCVCFMGAVAGFFISREKLSREHEETRTGVDVLEKNRVERKD